MTRKTKDAIIAAIKHLRDNADDKTASECPAIYETLKEDGHLVKAGTRINWHGDIKIAGADLWDAAENNPDNAPNLWKDLAYRDGIRVIPDVISVTDAFSYGELGWWGDDIYRSIMAGEKTNVYTPSQYPAGWENAE